MEDKEKNNKLDPLKVLEEVRKLVKEEGFGEAGKADEEQLVIDYLLPALEELKEIQSFLYEPFYATDASLVRKLKNSVVRKLANVTRNTVELSFMRQQKFNDNVSLILSYLLKENKRLKAEVAKLQGK